MSTRDSNVENVFYTTNNLGKLTILLAFWLLCFYPIFPALLAGWLQNSNSSHGILVPFISLYLIWRTRDKLSYIMPAGYRWGGYLLAISLLIYIVSLVGAVAVVTRIMFLFSLYGIILFTQGKEIFSVVRFPLLFLLFMIPVPESVISEVALPLQNFATIISSILLELLSIPVLREGNMLYFSQTQLEVAEACSGLRSIVSLGMLSVIFCSFIKKGMIIRKMILLVSVIPIALMANILRVTGTGILANFYDAQLAQGFLHEFSGIVVFIIGFFTLGIIYKILVPQSDVEDR